MLLKSNPLVGGALAVVLVIASGGIISTPSPQGGGEEFAASLQRKSAPAVLSFSARMASVDRLTDTPAPGAAYGRWGFDDSGIDPQANPGDSFFDFANGAWAARAAIPADKSRLGMFDVLTDRTQEQVRAIIEEAARSSASPDSDAGKIGALYNAFMDEGRIERLDLPRLEYALHQLHGSG